MVTEATIKVSYNLWPTNYTFSYTIKWGATFNAFYFTTVDENMQPSGEARSWHITYLLYTTLKASYYLYHA